MFDCFLRSLMLRKFLIFSDISLQLKEKLQVLTLGIGVVGLASAYVSYSPEIAARYIRILVLF